MEFLDKFRREKKKESVEKSFSEDEKLVQLIQSKYKKSYNNKSKYYEKWSDCEKAYTGELFLQNKIEYKAKELSNYIFSTVETLKPIMLSNYPKTTVIPQNLESFEKSRVVQNALDYEWRRVNMFGKLLEGVDFVLKYGTCVYGLFWNGNKDGIGQVECKVISPFNFFLSPSAKSIEESDYVIYATYKSVGELIEAYPEKKEELKSNTTSNLDNNILGLEETDNASDKVLLIECYHRDYAVETSIEEELKEDGTKVKYKVTKKKYPKGRRTIIGGDVLLYDGENPYLDGKFPFSSWHCYPNPNEFFGMGEVENLISPQNYFSDVMNSIIDSAGLMGNPIWVLDKNCGVEKNSLTNRRGLVIRKNPGTDVRREAPPPLPAYITNIIDMLKKDIEQISGVYDVVRGERPSGISAAAAINALNEQAQGRIKLKVQLMEIVIADLGGMWLKRIQQFWETKRTIRVMGGMYEPNENTIAIGTKKYSYFDVSKDDLDGDYDVEVVAGSTMQENKTARLQQLIQLAQTPAEDGMPMVDRKTILENSGLDNSQDIIEYFENMKAQQSQNSMSASQEQVQAQMEMQSQKHEQEKEKMVIKHDMDKQDNDENFNKELLKEQMFKEKENGEKQESNKPLQENENDLQLNGDSGQEEQLKEILVMLSKMSDEEIEALMNQDENFRNFVMAIQEMLGGEVNV